MSTWSLSLSAPALTFCRCPSFSPPPPSSSQSHSHLVAVEPMEEPWVWSGQSQKAKQSFVKEDSHEFFFSQHQRKNSFQITFLPTLETPPAPPFSWDLVRAVAAALALPFSSLQVTLADFPPVKARFSELTRRDGLSTTHLGACLSEDIVGWMIRRRASATRTTG